MTEQNQTAQTLNPQPAAAQTPAGAERKPKTPQPFKIVEESKDLAGVVTGYVLKTKQPPEDITDVNALAKWLRTAGLPAGQYRIMRDCGPLAIAQEQKPVTKISLG